ncbi:MAG: DUF2851 family protein [Crocinitomicaceae bacterium]|nr:DUF2851 family protein [Crocinitomicaceae bacterium]MBK8926277.1 DUF2851 family protein [Crocinitomicaceae bacterium]
MREEYLHYLFITRQLGNTFKTSQNKDLKVLSFGQQNPNAGPDFLTSIIEFDNKRWAGSIEFHIKASDWYLHRHQHDKNYKNVIAHFVYEYDADVEIGGVALPVVELKNLISEKHLEKFNLLFTDKSSPIACEKMIQHTDEIIISSQKEKALINRLERKAGYAERLIHEFKGDLKKVFFILLARAFGGKVNADAFELLARFTDLNIIEKNRDNSTLIHALLFGISGMLPAMSDEAYCKELTQEFSYLKHKYQLREMEGSCFRFSRMNPPGYPTIRLAQLAELIRKKEGIFDQLPSQMVIADLLVKMQIDLPAFWQNHYHFKNVSIRGSKNLTHDFCHLVLVNAVVPYLFACGIYQADEYLKMQATDILSELPAEKNSLIEKWKKLNLSASSAYDTQALIEQKNEFCDKKKCLICSIGNSLLRA